MTTTAAPEEPRTDSAEPAGGGRAGGPGGIGAGRAFGWMLVITGFLGLLAAWVITLDKMELLKNADFKPACSINEVMSCGSIMQSDQAEAFGFPNPLLGLVAYGAVIAIGMGLLAGDRYRRWFWLGLQAGTLFGVSFCTWLMYQSLYDIGALCLWCCLVWAATIVMFWYTTVHNIRHRVLRVPEGMRALVLEFAWVLPVLHLGIVFMLVLTRWGSALWA